MRGDTQRFAGARATFRVDRHLGDLEQAMANADRARRNTSAAIRAARKTLENGTEENYSAETNYQA